MEKKATEEKDKKVDTEEKTKQGLEDITVLYEPSNFGLTYSDDKVVVKIDSGSQSDREGIKAGWIISTIKGVEMKDKSSVEEALKAAETDGTTVTITFTKPLLSVGDNVRAQFTSGEKNKYPGEITKVNGDGTFAIVFNDGDTREKCPRNELIKKESEKTKKEGELRKKTGDFPYRWQARYCILNNRYLVYSATKGALNTRRIFLGGATVNLNPVGGKYDFTVQVAPCDGRQGRIYYFMARKKSVQEEWVKAIKSVIVNFRIEPRDSSMSYLPPVRASAPVGLPDTIEEAPVESTTTTVTTEEEKKEKVPLVNPCDNCEVAEATVTCLTCKENYCDKCDAEQHTSPKKRLHVRVPIGTVVEKEEEAPKEEAPKEDPVPAPKEEVAPPVEEKGEPEEILAPEVLNEKIEPGAIMDRCGVCKGQLCADCNWTGEVVGGGVVFWTEGMVGDEEFEMEEEEVVEQTFDDKVKQLFEYYSQGQETLDYQHLLRMSAAMGAEMTEDDYAELADDMGFSTSDGMDYKVFLNIFDRTDSEQLEQLDNIYQTMLKVKARFELFMNAAANGDVALVQKLITAKATKEEKFDINEKDIVGNGAMLIAAGAGKIEVVKELLAQGARKGDTNLKGETPAAVAKEKGHDAIVELLG